MPIHMGGNDIVSILQQEAVYFIVCLTGYSPCDDAQLFESMLAHNAKPRRMSSAVLRAIRAESALVAHCALGLLDQTLAYVNRTKV